MKVRIKFRKYGALKFIGHLDVMRFFQKVMLRAEIPIAYTGGYSPHMIMSFASPLGIGLTSDGEYFDIELDKPINSAEAVRRMNAVSVEGIDILSFRRISEDKKMTGMAIVAAADYLVSYLPDSLAEHTWPENWPEQIPLFLRQEKISVLKQTKRSEAITDIRPLIYQMTVREEESIYLQLAAGSVQNVKPDLVIQAFSQFMGINEAPPVFCHRLELYADTGIHGGRTLVTLESLGSEIKGDEEITP